jgi:uncharacterized protein YjbJ (UPF0337 family)
MINKDVVKGRVREEVGHAQDIAGAATDRPGEQLKGKANIVAGKIQQEVGKAKENIKRSLDDEEL